MILLKWIPQYKESMEYLAIVFPICVFDGKMQLLYNTYFKVWREERILLILNMITCIVSFIFCFISVYIFHSVIAIVYSMVLVILIRSILGSCYLSRREHVPYEKNLFIEIGLCVLFILVFSHMDWKSAFAIYSIMYTICIIRSKEKIRLLFKVI